MTGRSSVRVPASMVVEAARGCLANPLRSGLGALAIAVAVGTMAVVVTGLDGFARYAQRASARAFGSDTFVLARVTTSEASRKELAERLARNRPVTRSDVRFLDRYAAGQVLYAPLAQARADVTAGGRRFENASVSGTAASLFEIRDLGIDRGRFIRRDEEDRAAQIAVIGMDVAEALFPGLDPIGKVVRVGGRGFTVVGTQTRQGSSGGASLDRFVWMPLQAFERTFGAPVSLQVFARAPQATLTMAAEDRARVTMRARRQRGPGEPDTFDILTPEAARGFVQRLSERIGAAAAPISVMALLAAIVVVTNTTLVSVTQRTREIGVRRALGAARRDITIEVLAEASLIAIAGGAVGLIGAQTLLGLASRPLDLDLSVRFSTVAWSLGAAAASGIVAGWYPARRAARIDPIVAIRQE
jgi:putative ABC transport system permease protein